MKLLAFFFFLSCFLTIQSQSLVDTIYTEVDNLTEQPSLQLLSQLDGKIEAFSKAVSVKEEHMALVVLQCQMGFYYSQFNAIPKAINHYEKAWKRYKAESLAGYDMIEYCLKPLGNLYTMSGNFSLAEQTISSYINIAKQQNDKAQEVAGMQNLSVVYNALGKYTTAQTVLKEALEFTGLTKSQRLQLENNLAASLMSQNKLDEAEILIASSNQDVIGLQNQAQILLRQKQFLLAIELLKKSEKILISSGDASARSLSKLYVNLARTHQANHDESNAETYYNKAYYTLVPYAEPNSILEESQLYAETTFLDIFDGLAQIDPNLEQALAYSKRSSNVSELLKQSLTDQVTKGRFLAQDRLRSEFCLNRIYEAYQGNINDSIFNLALNYAERSKVQLLQTAINEKSLLEQFPNDSLLIRRQSLKHEQELLINDLIKSRLSAEEITRDSIQSRLREIALDLKSMQAQVSKAYPLKKSVINVADLQSKLQKDNAHLVEYFFGNKVIFQFSVSAEKYSFKRIEKDELFSSTLNTYLEFFESPSKISEDVTRFTDTAFEFCKLLKFPNFESKNLILVPDGLLNFVSFDALLTESTMTFQFEKMPFLVHDFNIFQQISATSYLHSKDVEKQEDPRALGVFPVFENTSQELTYSKEEALTVRRIDNSTLLLNEDATKSRFLEIADKFDVLHLSTHATGGNFITPAQLAFFDEPLLLNEVYAQDLNANLVILSACETSIGRLQAGEGAMSLARGFQYAGAKQQLVSLWQVNDKSTSQLMSSFYNHYFDGHSVGYSNTQSKRDYLNNESIKNAKKSPYYWGAFIAISPQVQIEPGNLWWIIGFIALTIILITFAIYFYRPSRKKLKA